MNSSDTVGQGVSKNPGWDLIQAQDLIADIVHLQKFLAIANILRWEDSIEVPGEVGLLLDSYQEAAIPEKLQAISVLIESVRKAID